MFFQLFLGGLLIGISVIFHAFALDVILRLAGRWDYMLRRLVRPMWKPVLSAIVVLCVSISHIAQIWLWAIIYLLLPDVPLHDLNSALYFSTTTMTTLGFGDITLPAPWNMLSAIEAMNGFMVFGWSTAFIFELISQVYRREGNKL